MHETGPAPPRISWPTLGDGRGRRIYAGAALIAAGLVLLAVALGAGAEPGIAGLPDAGPLTAWGLPLVRFCSDLCAVATVGTLLAAAVLAPPGSPERAACARAAGRWALGWALAIVASYLFTVSDVVAVPVPDLLAAPALLGSGLSILQARVLPLVLAVVVAAAVAARVPRLPKLVPLVLAVFGTLPVTYVGHAASATDHDIALSALMTHLVTVSLWAGGLGAVLAHFRRSAALPVVLARFSTLALCCFAGVAVSGVAAAWVRLNAPSDLWRSEYGWLLLAKTAALGVLALFGRAHRRRTVARAADRSVRIVFTRLAAGELIVMGAAMALAVALSRTPPPAPGGGHDGLLEYDLAPFRLTGLLTGLLTEIRPDPMILLLLALALAGYLAGVRRAGAWPPARTFAWCAGLALLGLVLLGGVGAYARAMLSMQAVQLTVLAVIAPVLLCRGAPLTLAARATTRPSPHGAPDSPHGASGSPHGAPDSPHGASDSRYGATGSWLPIRRPALLAVLPIAYMIAFPLLYRTGWLPWALFQHVPHLLTATLFFAGGLVVSWMLAGADPLPRPLSRTGRAVLLGSVVMVQLAVSAFLLLGPPVAQDWFLVVAPPGAPDPLTDQRLAGAVHLLAAATLVLLARPSGERDPVRPEAPHDEPAAGHGRPPVPEPGVEAGAGPSP
ncbi:bifunctional copper resistance protein CopD/cytochrome c oxidase assembly protein [[Actinomadura] parvosata]|uniref:bifunctional copper resistance protein CopD/cytochrome c oxidase assembly protein n=1 Tax=[Actinomadura] parvosata TaxID=1955412 RepID=UPI00406C09E3